MNPITFDAAFYLENNDDVRAAVTAGTIPDALTHFLQFGQFELRDPNAQFDTSYYLAENPDVLRAVSSGALPSAFAHFQAFGQFEGVARAPSPVFEEFNEQTYLAANPDVAAAVANGTFANGFQHFLQFGFGEERPGAGLDPVSQLAGRLGELDTANANVDVALEAAARLVDANDDVDRDAEALQTFIDGFGTSQLTAAIGEAQSDASEAQLTAAQTANALAQDRLLVSDAQLNANLAEARADVNAIASARTLLQARDNAEAALARDVSADGSNEDVLTGVRDAIGTFLGSGGAGTATINRGSTAILDGADAPITVQSLLDRINSALELDGADRDGAVNAILADLDGAGSLSVSGTSGSAASRTALTTELNVADQRADLIVAADNAETNLENAATATPATAASTAIDAFLTAEGDVAAREVLIEANTDAQQELSDAVALLNGLRGFQAVVVDRDELAADINEQFDVAVEVVDESTETAEIGVDDVFVFDANEAPSTISGFEAGDVLFVGTGFTPVELTGAITGPQGNANALEIFVQQTDTGVNLFIENQAFEGSTTGEFGGSQITLTGVDADDLILDANGFIRFSDADALVA